MTNDELRTLLRVHGEIADRATGARRAADARIDQLLVLKRHAWLGDLDAPCERALRALSAEHGRGDAEPNRLAHEAAREVVVRWSQRVPADGESD